LIIAIGDLSPAAGYLTEQIIGLPEINRPEMPDFDIKEYSPLIDSSQMGPDNWREVADDIGARYYDYDGFVVIMGTGKELSSFNGPFVNPLSSQILWHMHPAHYRLC
jgi:hypothetical protein